MKNTEHTLWYTRPAQNWNEALPLGNGSLGAMQFGGVDCERFCLNADTLWSGHPLPDTLENQTESFAQICAMAKENHLEQAQHLAEQALCGAFGESYLPLGELTLTFSDEEATGYCRDLDLQTAVSSVFYRIKEANHLRQALVSVPHACLAVRVCTQNKPETHSFTVGLSSQLQSRITAQDGLILCEGQCPSHVAPNYVQAETPVIYNEQAPGMGFVFAVRVLTDGTCEQGTLDNNRIIVSNARETVLLLCAETSFAGHSTAPQDDALTYRSRCLAHLEVAAQAGWESIYNAHVQDYQAMASRCALSLATENHPGAGLPTDERLRRFSVDKTDFGLAALLFHYGRYLMLCASRPGTQAANLQGIWNAQLRAPWCSNYTLNINTEMNYWPVFSAHLAECAQPLLSLLNTLAQTGARTARALYGTEGFVAHHNTDLWRLSTPVGEQQPGCACYGFWPFGAAWLCRTAWEAYEYGQDTALLEHTVYPLLQDASKALVPLLQKDENGKLFFGPATSPENEYLAPYAVNGKLSVSRWSAMGQEILWDLLLHCSEAAGILGRESEAKAYRATRDALVLPAIGTDGRLLEWDREYPEAEPHHRHISHLFGLHPGERITPQATPELAQACKKSLLARGDAGTGWSLAWKLNQWARLGDGTHAWKLLCDQLHAVSSETVGNFEGGGSYPNLFCAHPPFQIDGNFGAAAGILELLLQSSLTKDCAEVRLLPALPPAWSTGHLEGARAKGGITVSLMWKNGCFFSATLCTDTTCRVVVQVAGKIRHFKAKAGESIMLCAADMA